MPAVAQVDPDALAGLGLAREQPLRQTRDLQELISVKRAEHDELLPRKPAGDCGALPPTPWSVGVATDVPTAEKPRKS